MTCMGRGSVFMCIGEEVRYAGVEADGVCLK
jgi:hypothetical protein